MPTDLSSATSAGVGKALGMNDLCPHYSPDGFHLIFVNTANGDSSRPDVWTADLDGRNRVRLFENATLPDWK